MSAVVSIHKKKQDLFQKNLDNICADLIKKDDALGLAICTLVALTKALDADPGTIIELYLAVYGGS